MFTGLIQDVGEVASLERGAARTRLRIRTAKLPAGRLAHGESIAVDGCCLSIVAQGPGSFTVEVSPETLARTTLGGFREGTRVNLERALALGDRLGGHLVLGHVDGVGRIVEKGREGDFLRLVFEVPPSVEPWLVEKGSVAVDGISLTVNEIRGARFSVMLIPETQVATALAAKEPGASVNLEGDVIGKYVARLLARRGGAGELRIDEAFLREHGFA